MYRTEILNKRNYRGFFWARFGRIYPIHIFVLSLFVLFESLRYFYPTNFSPFSLPEKSVHSLVANIFLIHSWGIFDHLTWNHPSWSISTEWAAYLLFPFLCVLTKNWKTKTYLISGIISIILLFTMNKLNGSLDLTYDYGFFRCFCEFFLGTSLYYLYLREKSPQIFQTDSFLHLILIILLVFLALSVNAEYDFLIIVLLFNINIITYFIQ